MQIRVVTLRYNEALQGFPEEALRAATFGREVLNVTEHFCVHGNVPRMNDLASKEGSSSGSNRVKRGGSWNNNADNCTSSNRNNNNPSNDNNNNGFRLSSALQEHEGSHPVMPALRRCGDEHAKLRPASSESDRHAGNFLRKE